MNETTNNLPTEYVTIAELAARLSLSTKTIRNKMASGIFREGVHYFRPPGLRPRFKWSAIMAWLESASDSSASIEDYEIPMRRGYNLGSPGKLPGANTIH